MTLPLETKNSKIKLTHSISESQCISCCLFYFVFFTSILIFCSGSPFYNQGNSVVPRVYHFINSSYKDIFYSVFHTTRKLSKCFFWNCCKVYSDNFFRTKWKLFSIGFTSADRVGISNKRNPTLPRTLRATFEFCLGYPFCKGSLPLVVRTFFKYWQTLFL